MERVIGKVFNDIETICAEGHKAGRCSKTR